MPTAAYELSFLPDVRGIAAAAISGAERARTLDIVARWLVRDLIDKTGQRSATELTDAAFAVIHPDLAGRRLAKPETALIADYQRIKRDVVEPLLGAGATAPTIGAPISGSAPSSTSAPTVGDDRVPAGYKIAWRKRKGDKAAHAAGLKRYSGDCLTTKLRELMKQGIVKDLSDADLDTFQRIANVETGGGTQALNTWDLGIVSIGFFQLTLLHGKVQRWIARAPAAFSRYGIVLEPTRKYTFKHKDEVITPIAIQGAASYEELRWNGWGDRFYRAGLDPEIIAAEVVDGKQILQTGRYATAKRYLAGITGGYELFGKAYDGSLPLRGLYQEALNNHPAAAKEGIRAATRAAQKEATQDPGRFYELTKQAMLDSFAKHKGDAKAGKRLVDNTAMTTEGCPRGTQP